MITALYLLFEMEPIRLLICIEQGIKNQPISKMGYHLEDANFFKTGSKFGDLGFIYPPRSYLSTPPPGNPVRFKS